MGRQSLLVSRGASTRLPYPPSRPRATSSTLRRGPTPLQGSRIDVLQIMVVRRDAPKDTWERLAASGTRSPLQRTLRRNSPAGLAEAHGEQDRGASLRMFEGGRLFSGRIAPRFPEIVRFLAEGGRRWRATPRQVRTGSLRRDRRAHGDGRSLRQMRAACRHGSGDAAPGSGDARAVSRRPLQMHALRLEADRGAAGMAGADILNPKRLPISFPMAFLGRIEVAVFELSH